MAKVPRKTGEEYKELKRLLKQRDRNKEFLLREVLPEEDILYPIFGRWVIQDCKTGGELYGIIEWRGIDPISGCNLFCRI